MDSIDIRDDNINVENIMYQIKKNIQIHKENGLYNADTEKSIKEPLKNLDLIVPKEEIELITDIDYINKNWNIKAEYNINSHRPIVGKLLIFGRRLINGEVKRYVDIILGKQSMFNGSIVRMLNHSREEISAIIKNQSEINKLNEEKIDKIINNQLEINNSINNYNNDINFKLKDIEKIVKTTFPDQIKGLNYFVFEEKFRGDSEIIRNKQNAYLEYFKNCKNVLDIGCGRGEFLTLLKENLIGSKGIDIDDDMVLYCKKNDLDVEKADVISYLESLKDKSLDGIFLGQIIEHIPSKKLIDLINLSYKKMKYGTYLVAETINPLCLCAHSNFYADLTHIKLIHPATIQFLLESAGFRDPQIKYSSPFPENTILGKMKIDDERMNDKEKTNLEIMNQNIEKLNSLLYGNQDYAIIVKK